MVSGPFWGCTEAPKVMVLLRTSFTNHVLKQCAFAVSSKAILKGFQTAASLQSEPQEAPKANRERSCWSSWSSWTPRNSYHTAPEGLENGFLSDFSKYLLVLHAIYASLGLTCCCLHSTGGSLRRAIHIHQLVKCNSHFTSDISFTFYVLSYATAAFVH